MKKISSLISIIILTILVLSCDQPVENRIFQTSTIDALIAGVYDGELTCQELLEKGNFGIGTFNGLDGEMIILDNTVYQVKADGKVYQPDLNIKTPFSSVCQFSIDNSITFKSIINFDSLTDSLNKLLPNKNLFYAIKISGFFKTIKTRSVPSQKKPYPPLNKITENQPEFTMEDISGTIIGFRCPDYVKGINVPGYHLHFLSDDKSKGGHVLSFNTVKAQCAIDILDKFTLKLPSNTHDFAETDLSKDRSKELIDIEK